MTEQFEPEGLKANAQSVPSSEEELVRRLYRINEVTAAETIERLSSDLAAAQKELKAEKTTRLQNWAAWKEADAQVEDLRRDLSASHQREEQMRRALERIAKMTHMDNHTVWIEAVQSEARRALGKDGSDG